MRNSSISRRDAMLARDVAHAAELDRVVEPVDSNRVQSPTDAVRALEQGDRPVRPGPLDCPSDRGPGDAAADDREVKLCVATFAGHSAWRIARIVASGWVRWGEWPAPAIVTK